MEKEDISKRIKQLENDKEKLLVEIKKMKKKPSGNIGYILLTFGILLIALAIVNSHSVAASIGIAITFWGAIILYIRPIRFIKKDILDSVVTEPYETYYKLFKEMGYKGIPQYVSPSTLWGLRNVVLYIPMSDQTSLPTDEQLSTEGTIPNNPQAIKLTPPGLGLSKLIEKELITDFTTVSIEYLQNNLEIALVEGLEIVETFQMEIFPQHVQVEMKSTIFDQAIMDQNKEDKTYIGDPLNSAIACVLARSTRKPIIITKIHTKPKEKTIITDFKVVGQLE